MSEDTPQDNGCALPALECQQLGFAYPREDGFAKPVLTGVDWAVPQGAFALLTGGTGSGKTTLLRLAKREVAPVGACEGSVRVFGQDVATLSVLESCQLVGYVFQSPDNQIVCDTVWHELAFGLENLGLDQREMRRRLSEVCIFLGIEGLFRKRCDELSGGQRQIVCLAAVLAMRPRLLLLDEPTAMLDPVAQGEFLALLFRANRELGITVVVATHDPAPMVPYATCAFAVEGGRVLPLDLDSLRKRAPLARATGPLHHQGEPVCLLRDVWTRYGRDGAWVLRGCDLSLREGEVRALVGGNGSGKSTLLSVVAGTLRSQRGRVEKRYRGQQALLPQQPKALLGCETVRAELMEWARDAGYGEAEVHEAVARIGLGERLDSHPYDLSGGQQQLLALEKLLLTAPRLLLLDEPTKGLDVSAREALAARLARASEEGRTIVMATHDMAFVRAVAHSVSLLFDGQTGEPEPVDEFFAHSWMWRA